MMTSASLGLPLAVTTRENCHLPLCERYFLRRVFRLKLSAMFISRFET